MNKIAVDAMGSEHSPAIEVEGAVHAAAEYGVDLVFVGQEDRIRAELARHDTSGLNLEVVHASEVVAMDESPLTAIRRKKDSSIRIAANLVRDGRVAGMVSAGNTGAVMATMKLVVGALSVVDRPALTTVLPTQKGKPAILLDVGANVDCKPHQLVQFAQLGKVYAEDLMGIANPRIGLLNIGEEPKKGDELAVAAYRELTKSSLNFVGNVEGRGIVDGGCDVLVCDGFVGNVLLKFYESVASFIVGLLTNALGDAKANHDLEEVFRLLDYTETGGAPLLGVNGIAIICHGGSPPKAIENAIHVADRAAKASMVSHFVREMAHPIGTGSG